MIGRDRRYGRGHQVSLKAKVGIATAILVGGGAIGVAAAASNHSPTSASNAGFSSRLQHHARSHHHRLSQAQLLAQALNAGTWTRHHGHRSWNWNWNQAFANLAAMNRTRTLNTMMMRNQQLAVQTGLVTFVDPNARFILLTSQTGATHVWFTNGATGVVNVTNSFAGVNALTANTGLTGQVMTNNNVLALIQALTNLSAVKAATTPAPATTTVSVQAGNGVTITITVTGANAAVQQQNTTTGTMFFQQTQNLFSNLQGLQVGDVALIAGVRAHGFLHAQRVLFFAAPAAMGMTPPASSGGTTSGGTSSGTPAGGTTSGGTTSGGTTSGGTTSGGTTSGGTTSGGTTSGTPAGT